MNSLIGALKSKTMWFNVISAGLEVISGTAGIPPGTMLAVNIVGNIALRTLTTTSLAGKVKNAE